MTMTKTGEVVTTIAFPHVWSAAVPMVTRRLAPVSGAIQGTALSAAAPAYLGLADAGIALKTRFAHIVGSTRIASTTSSMDIPPFRTGRPPV